MAGILNIVCGDTKGTKVQLQENSIPIDITAFSIDCRVGTLPSTTTLTAVPVDAENGECLIVFTGINPGTYPAEMVITDSGGIQTSEQFTIVARETL